MARTFNVKLVGVTHKNSDGSARQAYIRKFAKQGMPLMLRPEPNNPYDKNAVGAWITATVFWFFKEDIQLGYLDSRLAEEISRLINQGGSASAKIAEIVGGTPGAESYGVIAEITKNE